MAAWVYVLTNRKDGTLYIGASSDLPQRVYDHRRGTKEGFTQRYRLHRLVYFEPHPPMQLALQREKGLKRWNRPWKVRLINKDNPEWLDLSDRLPK